MARHRRTPAVLPAALLGALLLGTAACGDAGPAPLAIGTGTDAAADAARLSGSDGPISGYTVSGDLPTEPTEAPVYRWEDGIDDEAAVAALAAALGLGTAPVADDDGWKVTDEPGVLRVYRAAGSPWVYARTDQVNCPPLPLDGYTGPDTAVSCDAVATAGSRAGTGSSAGAEPGATPDTVAPAAEPPSDAAALALAAPVLAAAGPATAAAEPTVDSGTVVADPVVDGLPTNGAATVVSVSTPTAGADPSIATATGWLAAAVEGDDYPLITAAAGVDQLRALPQPLAPEICLPDLPDCGIAPPREVVITGAALGLQFHYDGADPVLVPAWRYSVADDGPAPWVVAVTPEYLTEPQPSAEPSAGSGSAEPGSPGVAPPDDPAAPPTAAPDPGATGTPVEPAPAISRAALGSDGRTLTLVGWGGVCSTYTGEAKETPTEVYAVIAAAPVPPGPDGQPVACPAIAVEVTVTVTLADPLGTRTLIDGVSGQEIPVRR